MIRPEPSKIVVPRGRGEVLEEPALGELAGAMTGARGRAGADPEILGARLSVRRKVAREEFLRAAREWARRLGEGDVEESAGERPWVITGHQVEFYHAGVWAKVIAADEVARRAARIAGEAGAEAFDLLVDHDEVERLGFEVPVKVGETWEKVAVDFGDAPAIAVEGMSAPTLELFEKWDAELATFDAARSDSLAFFLAALRAGIVRARDERRRLGYTEWMSAARAAFERSMGLKVHHVPTTWACRGRVWEWFVGEWVEQAETWGGIYNKHLAEYRRREGIKNAQRPMPDLVRVVEKGGDGEFELPFWIYRVGDMRERLVVRRAEGRVFVRAGVEEIEVTPGASAGVAAVLAKGFVIRPRALTLTMFVRLFLADVFIHGIGGALYDQVTDGILQELFGVVPAYGCVSAAWLLPLGEEGDGGDEGALSALLWRRHHVAHNPQLAIDPFTAVKTDVAELIKERRELVQSIARSLAEARNDRDARRQRRDWFKRLHAVNRLLHEKVPGVLRKIDREIAAVRDALERGKVLKWREWFFGLHERASLEKLIAKVREAS